MRAGGEDAGPLNLSTRGRGRFDRSPEALTAVMTRLGCQSLSIGNPARMNELNCLHGGR